MKSLATNSHPQLDEFGRKWMQVFQGDPYKLAERYWEIINDQINIMLPVLADKCMTFFLHEARSGWKTFWKWAGAEGDQRQSLDVWDRKYNPTGKRGRDSWVSLKP